MRKKKHAEHVNLERWLVSYADFITLLFAFFVVMYALSMQNLSKVKAAAESIRKAFGGPAVLVGAPTRASDLRDATEFSPFAGPQDPSGDLHRLKSELEEVAGLETGATDLSERMQTLFDSRGLVIRLSAKDFFARGEAVVRPDLQPLLDRIGRVVARSSRPVSIEGYTELDEAAKNSGFASDWELSTARAAWVAKYWIIRFELDPRRIGIAGYAHFRPLPPDPAEDEKSRASEWVRGKNRRVEIVILNAPGDRK